MPNYPERFQMHIYMDEKVVEFQEEVAYRQSKDGRQWVELSDVFLSIDRDDNPALWHEFVTKVYEWSATVRQEQASAQSPA